MSFEEFLKECPPESGKNEVTGQGSEASSFTVSDEVMQKIVERKPEEVGRPKQTSMWKEVERQENNWRNIEKQVELAHDMKVGTDSDSMTALQSSVILQNFKCPCASGYPVVDCLDENIEKPLHCQNIVKAYIQCVNKYTQNVMAKLAEDEMQH